MKILTKYHGEAEILESEIIHFDNGIPGFPEEHRFALLPLPEQSVFSIMQSVDSAHLAFVVAEPFTFFPEYDFSLDEGAIEQIGLESGNDAHILVILTIHEPFNESTANLQAPIVININSRRAKQVILNDEKYTTKHLLFEQQAKG